MTPIRVKRKRIQFILINRSTKPLMLLKDLWNNYISAPPYIHLHSIVRD